MIDTQAAPCTLQAWQSAEAELRGFLRRQLHDADAADDLLHEVFLKAMRQGDRFCQIDNARAWLFRVARNALVDLQRAARPFDPLPDELPALDEGPAPVEALAECLPIALASLSAADRDAIEQCELGGLSQVQYAELRGLKLPTAKSRIQRARTRLRAALVERCGVRFDAQTGAVCCHVPQGSRCNSAA
ncbi:MAG: sigma-70 family RNA polymerase sigma factor [Thiomonas sp.]|uniref:sigma-70 family RNA polymerase sigma factor n=1 Tax=Thiomonas sp. TaxID=2047785 RepID=UPI002A36BA18|nr:sigma-70 family RNA polymerase sigma factor [Thiomonas sp.]MDY0329725.1 sigma-70 family RNA polymerase sigma factor [Thiomonas sp.]